MKKINSKINTITVVFFVLFFIHQRTNAQDQTLEITGIVNDKDLHQSLPGVTVAIKGSSAGDVTNEKGEFHIKSKVKIPFTLVFTSLGFKPQEFEVVSLNNKIAIELNTDNTLLSEIVISASRLQERLLQSPVAIEKIDIRAIKESPAPTFYESLDNVKGVQLLTSSLTLKVPNSRGFNVPNNFRFMQLVDGVDVQAATLGVPLGNAIGPTELDIHSVEITPGAASALYGMNAINGLASLQTKNPFQYQGLSIYQRTGLNHVDGTDYAPSFLSEVAVRYAKAFNNKLAFKINASYLNGSDWISNTLIDQNPNNLKTANPNYQELNGENNPAADLWNNYGDERNNRVAVKATINGAQKTFNVSRTGYLEKNW